MFGRNEKFRLGMTLIMAIMSLALVTWGVGKIYIRLLATPKLITSSPGSQNSQTGATAALPKIKFWTMQVGLFKKEENARKVVAELRNQGLPAAVFNRNPWAVGIGLARTREEISAVHQILSQANIKALPKEVLIPERLFRVSGTGGYELTSLLKTVNGLINDGLSPDGLARIAGMWDNILNQKIGEAGELEQVVQTLLAEPSAEGKIFKGLLLYSAYDTIITEHLRK